MKELSIEKKAKAYDGALERAKEVIEYYKEHNRGDEASIEDLESIFPELKESEDERIRKELIKEINGLWENDSATWPSSLEKKNKYIAWLEKQGEQNPFDYENANIQQKDFAPQEDAPRYSIGDVLCDKSCTTLNKDAQPNFEIVDIRNGLYICDKGYIPISQQDEYELVAKKIEQKPAWSEEDEWKFSDILALLRGGENCHYNTPDLFDWLKSLKDRVQPQPKQKWSGYDKMMFASIMNVPGLDEQQKEWLIICSPQPKQEWSEEDECILFRTINNLKFLKDTVSIDPKYAINIIDIEREIDWLKSLRPQSHWKPSDEQMECLLSEVTAWTKGCPKQKVLESLYNDLKKLKA